ncbi:hypothetical protein JXA12_05445 [Candidatus Woesearchaeota archaeon]|nr:hypothetical protein [Candidatus Woesearchaeota archaeon]
MVTITSKEEQPLLGRTVIKATAEFEGPTPDRKSIRKDVAKAAGAKEEEVIIRRILTGHGGGAVEIEAAVYKDAADAAALEHKSIIAKHAAKKQKDGNAEGEAAPPAEEKKDE